MRSRAGAAGDPGHGLLGVAPQERAPDAPVVAAHAEAPAPAAEAHAAETEALGAAHEAAPPTPPRFFDAERGEVEPPTFLSPTEMWGFEDEATLHRSRHSPRKTPSPKTTQSKQATQRAFNKLLWIQNDFISRHYANTSVAEAIAGG